ncbi:MULTISPECIES: hypothetical protein [unclassified Desulfovibrio]|uniref:hypothetical protein n=1 Tax=unclassified Desulfovibrio TaxID=2593640 RepID=UPI002FD951D5
MSDTTTTITPEERHYYVREKQFQITSEDVRSWLMEATRDRRKTTYELNFRILRLVTALKSVEERAAELESESARLRAERDWLAENIADRPCAYDSCPFGLHRPTGPDDDDCDKTRAQCWKEAARRAVAAGEGE